MYRYYIYNHNICYFPKLEDILETCETKLNLKSVTKTCLKIKKEGIKKVVNWIYKSFTLSVFLGM